VGRTEDIAAGLAGTRKRLAEACANAGREPDEVTLVAVTKTYPADDVLRLARLGVRDIGENRDQEAAGKAAEVAAAGERVTWHFVGHLQRNKCRSVVTYVDVVHSVDSVRLAEALARAAAEHEREFPIGALVQVSIDGDESRGGVTAGDGFDRVAEAIAVAERLRLLGVMAVAPLDWRPEDAFARLREDSERLRRTYPEAVWISAGMSDDLEAAVAHGSTHVRIGSALLGKRAPLR
jgi:pyridoxal phosphate enzyme (YggS family)